MRSYVFGTFLLVTAYEYYDRVTNTFIDPGEVIPLLEQELVFSMAKESPSCGRTEFSKTFSGDGISKRYIDMKKEKELWKQWNSEERPDFIASFEFRIEEGFQPGDEPITLLYMGCDSGSVEILFTYSSFDNPIIVVNTGPHDDQTSFRFRVDDFDFKAFTVITLTAEQVGDPFYTKYKLYFGTPWSKPDDIKLYGNFFHPSFWLCDEEKIFLGSRAMENVSPAGTYFKSLRVCANGGVDPRRDIDPTPPPTTTPEDLMSLGYLGTGSDDLSEAEAAMSPTRAVAFSSLNPQPGCARSGRSVEYPGNVNEVRRYFNLHTSDLFWGDDGENYPYGSKTLTTGLKIANDDSIEEHHSMFLFYMGCAGSDYFLSLTHEHGRLWFNFRQSYKEYDAFDVESIRVVGFDMRAPAWLANGEWHLLHLRNAPNGDPTENTVRLFVDNLDKSWARTVIPKKDICFENQVWWGGSPLGGGSPFGVMLRDFRICHGSATDLGLPLEPTVPPTPYPTPAPSSSPTISPDCNGVLYGDGVIDECGICRTAAIDLDTQPDCKRDCFGKWGGAARPDQCGVCQENLRAAVTYCDFYWAGWYVQDGAFTYQMSYQVAEYDVPEAECDEFAAFDKELEQKGSTLGGHDAAVKDMKEESAVDTAMKETGIDGDKTEGKEDDGDMGEKGSDDWGDWGDKEGDYGDKGTTTEKDVAETVMQIGDADDKSEAVDELVKGIKAIQKARTDSAKSWETLDNINAPPTPAPVPSRMGRNGADATPTMAPTQYPSTTQDVLCAGNVCSPSCDNKPLCVSNGCVLVDHALNGAPPHMLCTLPGASR